MLNRAACEPMSSSTSGGANAFRVRGWGRMKGQECIDCVRPTAELHAWDSSIRIVSPRDLRPPQEGLTACDARDVGDAHADDVVWPEVQTSVTLCRQ
jgi:hypothetical protein